MLNLLRYYMIPYSDVDHGWKGTHCWGFVKIFLRDEAGIEILDYQKDDSKNLTSQACEKAHEEYVEIKQEDLQPFDLILFHVSHEIPVHIGIFIGGGQFIHMLGNRGVGTARLKVWERKVTGYYRHKDLACKSN